MASPADEDLSEIAQVVLRSNPERSAKIADDIADPSIRVHVLTLIAKCHLRPTGDPA